MNEMIKTIEKSEMWERLNIKVKALCEEHNQNLTQEQYQAIRNMMILKVMMEDEEVKEKACKSIYNELSV